eukprot:CAMPEP_0174366152 /NCGR_PEP_ID=MMETSP0811_2-20130205/80112_1 /TAXON_ID=73025 ORGANISM="Eutreptiella gymnastica-like, Strain CCMP1594" /NCGR_SAMPLE_ID=MMETSP0811_2 /ASSEMBLY_ACC=CAM_ASM_000667 /LENGTH=173 /DNA_ID=CAMNT_0015507455 /DNA_START=768 /DNA_END=1289 /DNA_ORIENTATION=+
MRIEGWSIPSLSFPRARCVAVLLAWTPPLFSLFGPPEVLLGSSSWQGLAWAACPVRLDRQRRVRTAHQHMWGVGRHWDLAAASDLDAGGSSGAVLNLHWEASSHFRDDGPEMPSSVPRRSPDRSARFHTHTGRAPASGWWRSTGAAHTAFTEADIDHRLHSYSLMNALCPEFC